MHDWTDWHAGSDWLCSVITRRAARVLRRTVRQRVRVSLAFPRANRSVDAVIDRHERVGGDHPILNSIKLPENERTSRIAPSYHSQPRLIADIEASSKRDRRRSAHQQRKDFSQSAASPFSDGLVPVWGRPKGVPLR